MELGDSPSLEGTRTTFFVGCSGHDARRVEASSMNEGLQLPNAQWMQQVAAAGWWSQGTVIQGAAQGATQSDTGTPSSTLLTQQRRGVKRKGPADASAHSAEHQWAYKYATDPATPRMDPSSFETPQQVFAGPAVPFHGVAAATYGQQLTSLTWPHPVTPTDSLEQAQQMHVVQGGPSSKTSALKTSAGPPIFSRGVGLIFASSADHGGSAVAPADHVGLVRQQSVP